MRAPRPEQVLHGTLLLQRRVTIDPPLHDDEPWQIRLPNGKRIAVSEETLRAYGFETRARIPAVERW